MLLWLIALVVMLVLWGLVWQRNPRMAFGILLGLPLAWIVSRLTAPYFTGQKPFPVWLPPTPFATVAVTLFVFGAVVWIRGTRAERKSRRD
ncbi:MAG TPA: hypothetical protein VF329_09200 [Gammaproteobacteria bacterium]